MSAAVNECPFKSHEDLGISKPEYDGLVKTLLLMENDQMYWIHGDAEKEEGQYPFNMATWREHMDCGSVCCIGGTAELVEGLKPWSLSTTSKSLLHKGSPDLYRLFYEYGGGVTPKIAAKALRGYLTTGKTDWRKARL